MKKTKRQALSPYRSLETSIRQAGLSAEAERIFLLWPNLREASLRFCSFISPLVYTADGKSLLDTSISAAFAAYLAERDDEIAAYKAFIRALLKSAPALAGLRISIEDGDGNRVLWDEQTPILDWVKRFGHSIHVREYPQVAHTPILVSMLQKCFTSRDLKLANVSLELRVG